MFGGKFERAAIARGEQSIFVAFAASPDRPDRMDHVARLELEASRDFRLAGRTAAKREAGFEQLRAGGAMDRPIDAAAGKPSIGGVDDRIDRERRDVGDNDFEAGRRGC
jgi:hypothetical protein